MNNVLHSAFAGSLEVLENRVGVSCEHWLVFMHVFNFHSEEVADAVGSFGSVDHAGHELANQIIVSHLTEKMINFSNLKKFLTFYVETSTVLSTFAAPSSQERRVAKSGRTLQKKSANYEPDFF